jgi:hypothetical protein
LPIGSNDACSSTPRTHQGTRSPNAGANACLEAIKRSFKLVYLDFMIKDPKLQTINMFDGQIGESTRRVRHG